jgi:hypothetical protein
MVTNITLGRVVEMLILAAIQKEADFLIAFR